MDAMNAGKSEPQPQTLQRIRAIIPEIEARADEIERNAAVPSDLLERLERAGAFRICLPAMFGGEDLSIAEASVAIEEVAAVDASVAWHMMVAAGTQIITARLPLESLKAFYADGPDTWAKAAATPKGIAVPGAGGYRVSGRWPLASGAREFEWVSLGFLIKDEEGVRRLPNGMPDVRVCLVPRGDARVIETWDAVGLKGTRSDDIEVKDLFVPEDWQGSFFGPSSVNTSVLSLGMPTATAPNHLAVVTGILKGALGQLVRDSLTRKPAFNPAQLMKDDAVFQARYGEIASRVDGLCALAGMCRQTMQACIRERRHLTPMEAGRIGSAETLIHHEATGLMDQVMMLSGSASIYMNHRQQRRWRDLRCVAQHIAANIGNYGLYAKALIAEAAAAA